MSLEIHFAEHTIETPTHGRYLVLPGLAAGVPVLLGFHGYGETAEDELRRLQTVPGIEPNALARISTVLIVRGVRDEWYTSQKQAADEERLRAAGVAVQSVVVNAGHEWTAECSDIASQFLAGSH